MRYVTLINHSLIFSPCYPSYMDDINLLAISYATLGLMHSPLRDTFVQLSSTLKVTLSNFRIPDRCILLQITDVFPHLGLFQISRTRFL